MENKISIRKFVFGIAAMCVVVVGFFLYERREVVAPTSDTVSVVTSFYPLYFFASEIGGEGVQVHNITPAGAEPHEYEPTTQDMLKIEKSDLLILNGGGLEPWGDKVIDTLSGNAARVVTVGTKLADREFVEDGAPVTDPHIWLSPVLAKEEVKEILRGFIAVDPDHAATYEKNAAVLLEKLDLLNEAFTNGLAQCDHRDIVTSHAAFSYLAAAYGLRQVPISGLSPEGEPSPRQMAEVADFIRKNKITYIFFESLVSPKFSDTLAQEVGVQTLVLNPLEGLTRNEIVAGKTYFTEMRLNLANLRTALQCQ